MAVGRLSRLHLVAAAANTCVAAVLVVLTFLLPGTAVPGPAVWVVFGQTFPIFALALFPVALSQPRSRFRDFAGRRAASRQLWAYARQRVPARVAVLIGCIFFLGWLATMSGIRQVQGQPERHDGRYYADNHGTLIPLTKSEYEQQLDHAYRGFAAVPMGLNAVAIGLILIGRVPRPEDDI